MRWMEKLNLRFRSLFRKPRVEEELSEELRFHVEQQVAENLARGMRPEEARYAALRTVGGVAQIEEECRDARRVRLIENFVQDVRYALRGLRNQPGFALIALLTLALGIGANTAIFSVVNAVVFRPLPYPHPERLVALETRMSRQPELEPAGSAQDFFDLREQAKSFSGLAAVSAVWSNIVSGRGGAEREQALYVSADLFPLLGVTPAAGRVFLADEDDPHAPRNVLMLGYSYWQRKFGGDASVVGQSLRVDGSVYTIAGVLPADFEYLGFVNGATGSDIALWMPLATNQLVNSSRGVRYLSAVGRLRDGVSLAQASAEVQSAWNAIVAEHPDTDTGFDVRLTPLAQQAVGSARTALLLLLGVVGFVLLIACANVANLLLARTAARQKEIAVRRALGATTGRLSRQTLTESLLLSLIGGSAGLLCAWLGLRALLAIGPATLPRRGEIALDLGTLIFTLGTSLLTGVLCGLAPALELGRRELHPTLKEGGRSGTGDAHRVRGALIVAEVALATMLVGAAGLLVRSFAHVLDVNPGFATRNVVTLSTQMPPDSQAPAQRLALFREIEARLLTVPGVRSAGAVSRLPLLGSNLGSWLQIEGRTFPPNEHPDVEYRVASPGYFPTLGIPLLQGRLFDERDDANPGGVAVIDDALAKRFFPGEDPLGKHIKFGLQPSDSPWITIVGVVGSIHHVSLETSPRAQVYRPYLYNPLFSPIFVVRADGNAAALIPSLREAFHSVSADFALYNVFEMQDLVEHSTAARRFPMLLLAGFAVLALSLAAVGIYGVISQSVVQRTHEIGVRIAIGASLGDILRLILGQGLRLATLGVALGVALALLLGGVMRGMLFGVTPHDVVALGVAPFVLLFVAALACLVPALRGARLDPLEALRYE